MEINNLLHGEYRRKSSETKERQALSNSQQRAENKKVELREHLKVVKRFQESRSAFKPHNRPEFDEMIKLIKEGKINAILTWKPDRLCRNPEEGGLLLQLLQDGVLKEIRTSTGDVYTQDSDHLILQIHFGMANQYSRNLSQNVKRGLVYKCEKGEYPRPAPIGYESYGEIGQRKMRPHPVEAAFIIKAYELAATGGMSLNQICDELYNQGLRTERGKRVGKSHLHNILICPTYYGYFYHSGELYEGYYEPIIKKSLYDEVQEALHKRSKPRTHVWEQEHTYNGLMTCGECGCQITTSVKEKYYKRTNRTAIYIYHHCTHKKVKCSQKPITGQELEKLLIENFSQISIDQETWELGIKLFKAKHEEEMSKLSKRERYFQNQYHTLTKRLKEIVRMRADQELTKEEFLEQKAEILQERKTLEEKLGDNKTSVDTWLELCTKYLENAFSARDIIENGTNEEKRSLILDLGQNLILRDGKLDFKFKQPYDVLLLPQYSTNLLPGMDSNHDRQIQSLSSYR